MKILEQNGYKYSRKQFEGYKLRVMFKFHTFAEIAPTIITIYTTDENIESVEKVINELKTDKVSRIIIYHKATKEQDELTAQFIEETLKDI